MASAAKDVAAGQPRADSCGPRVRHLRRPGSGSAPSGNARAVEFRLKVAGEHRVIDRRRSRPGESRSSKNCARVCGSGLGVGAQPRANRGPFMSRQVCCENRCQSGGVIVVRPAVQLVKGQHLDKTHLGRGQGRSLSSIPAAIHAQVSAWLLRVCRYQQPIWIIRTHDARKRPMCLSAFFTSVRRCPRRCRHLRSRTAEVSSATKRIVSSASFVSCRPASHRTRRHFAHADKVRLDGQALVFARGNAVYKAFVDGFGQEGLDFGQLAVLIAHHDHLVGAAERHR